MPKPKRRTPIVPIPKAAEVVHHHESKAQNASKPTGRKQASHDKQRSALVGGRKAKRPREHNENYYNQPDAVKRRKTHAEGGAWRGRRSAGDAGTRVAQHWRPLSVVHQQAAFAVQRLLEADSSRKHGASLKSLTLAPHIEAKKATFAVTCQVLKFSRVLEQLDERAGLTSGQPKLGKHVALVLSYELLRGQGLMRKGPAERAVLEAEPRLRAALKELLRQEGAESLDELLEKQRRGSDHHDGGGGAGGGARASGGAGGGGPDVPHPRWVRVNLLKADVDDVVRRFGEHPSTTGVPAAKPKTRKIVDADAEQQARPAGNGDRGGGGGGLVRDPLLPDLLALPPGTDLHDHPLVTRGSVVLQSKASCMPARALAPEPGWTVVDCCAAPGNKTTHLAAIMGNKGRVLAFDKDPKRLARLRANAELTGASCIEARLADFLSVDPTSPEFSQVRAVLLDPSCSGSGTTFTRMDHLLPSHHQARAPRVAPPNLASPSTTTTTIAPMNATAVAAPKAGQLQPQKEQQQESPPAVSGAGRKRKQQKQEKLQKQEQGVDGGPALELDSNSYLDPDLDPAEAARVAHLARFQAAALSHALRFPALERLVYSTCSVHVAENEAVVAGALAQAAAAGLELADPFPSWHRRGLPLFPGAEKLVRTDAYQDGTDGFFVALFKRRSPGCGADTAGEGAKGDEAAAAAAAAVAAAQAGAEEDEEENAVDGDADDDADEDDDEETDGVEDGKEPDDHDARGRGEEGAKRRCVRRTTQATTTSGSKAGGGKVPQAAGQKPKSAAKGMVGGGKGAVGQRARGAGTAASKGAADGGAAKGKGNGKGGGDDGGSGVARGGGGRGRRGPKAAKGRGV